MLKIIAPKRKLRRAVDRNRARRRVRAALDRLRPGWRLSLTGVVMVDQLTLTLPFSQLRDKIKHGLSL